MKTKIEFLTNLFMKFQDPKTHKEQWYGSDMFKGEKMEFANIISACYDQIRLECLDGEHVVLPLNSIRILNKNNDNIKK